MTQISKASFESTFVSCVKQGKQNRTFEIHDRITCRRLPIKNQRLKLFIFDFVRAELGSSGFQLTNGKKMTRCSHLNGMNFVEK